MKLTERIASFPKEFLFGVATSSYQIEGSAFGGCGQSHWDDFAQQPGRVHNGENGRIACEHYNYWENDLNLVAEAGFKAYRFSFSWPRILPHNHHEVNNDGIDFYDRLIDGMLARGLTPCATLYHWDLPLRLHEAGGWQSIETAKRFADYSDIILRNFGDRLAMLAPINEPWCVAWLSHYEGLHAPGMTSLAAAAKAMHFVQLAHGLGVEVARAHGHQNVGAVLNKEFPTPIDNSALAQQKARLFDGIYNRWFEDSLFKGCYPQDVLELLEDFLPKDYTADLPKISAPLDWVGTNYYTRVVIVPDATVPNIGFRLGQGDLPQTDMGWEIYPEGLSFFLRRLATEYAPGKPLYVTENGMANQDVLHNGQVDDQARLDYLSQHLGEVKALVDEGLPIKGYFVWSLLDNYEWAFGYSKRFGIVNVDYSTQKRTPKASWHSFRNALAKSEHHG